MFSGSLIPLPIYSEVFYYTMLFIVLIVVLKVLIKGYTIKNSNGKEYSSFMLLLIITLYIGLRPISYQFGDMGTYNIEFIHYANGGDIIGMNDIFWKMFMKFCSSFMTAQAFFFLCAFLYVTPLYTACENWFGRNKYLPFLMFVASFSFWAYGTNGIRNGIATSLFVLGISLNKWKYLKYGVFVVSFLIHASLIIPLAAFILTLFHKNSKHYLIGWLIAIPLSLLSGGFWEGFFGSLGFADDRLSYLTDNQFSDSFSSVGFRWDFVLYSSAAVLAGYYFILKKNFEDEKYCQIFNIYVIVNAFWILVIRASFSNRFAYLSWFLMAVVVFYPFFKERFFKNQTKVLVYTILGYFGFTFFMFLKN